MHFGKDISLTPCPVMQTSEGGVIFSEEVSNVIYMDMESNCSPIGRIIALNESSVRLFRLPLGKNNIKERAYNSLRALRIPDLSARSVAFLLNDTGFKKYFPATLNGPWLKTHKGVPCMEFLNSQKRPVRIFCDLSAQYDKSQRTNLKAALIEATPKPGKKYLELAFLNARQKVIDGEEINKLRAVTGQVSDFQPLVINPLKLHGFESRAWSINKEYRQEDLIFLVKEKTIHIHDRDENELGFVFLDNIDMSRVKNPRGFIRQKSESGNRPEIILTSI